MSNRLTCVLKLTSWSPMINRPICSSYAMIGFQAILGLGGLILGAHLFVLAAESMAGLFNMSPLILALLIAPLATEAPNLPALPPAADRDSHPPRPWSRCNGR